MAIADWNAKVVFLPNAVRYNPPENPNVVIGWGKAFQLIPECALRSEAAKVMREQIASLGVDFERAFVDAFELRQKTLLAYSAKDGVQKGRAASGTVTMRPGQCADETS